MKTTASVILLCLFWAETLRAQTSRLLKVNYQSLVSKADLSYSEPVVRSDEGMPIGNGRMGTVVWSTPSALHFQINRVDLFCMGNNTRSFPKGHTDYSSGCGYMDINVVDYGDDVFSGKTFNQHLSVFEGLTTDKGNGITSRVIMWNDGDVMATEIDDQRANPEAINIDLRMLRYGIEYSAGTNYELTRRHAVQIRTMNHVATSRLEIRDGRFLLIQDFHEGTFYSASAVAIGVAGRKSKAIYCNEATVQLSAPPARGTFTILTASATSYDRTEDVGGLALKQLDAAQPKSFDDLVKDTRAWWSGFWPKGIARLHSADGVAGRRRKELYLLSLPHGVLLTWDLHAALLRHAVGHGRRPAHVGVAILVE